MDEQATKRVRSFNRTVTQRIGALRGEYLAHGRPLGESRVLWEIGDDGTDVRALRTRLDLDSGYLSRVVQSLERDGYRAEAILAGGDPAKEIAACAQRENCDLIAMATHGHRGLSDVLRGSVASELRHMSMVPVLMIRGLPHLHSAPAGPRPAQ